LDNIQILKPFLAKKTGLIFALQQALEGAFLPAPGALKA
jgi:hypothetical protein